MMKGVPARLSVQIVEILEFVKVCWTVTMERRKEYFGAAYSSY
jgi:hypothetical protein